LAQLFSTWTIFIKHTNLIAKTFESYLKVTKLLFYHLLHIAFICSTIDRSLRCMDNTSVSLGFLPLFSKKVIFC